MQILANLPFIETLQFSGLYFNKSDSKLYTYNRLISFWMLFVFKSCIKTLAVQVSSKNPTNALNAPSCFDSYYVEFAL